MGERVPEPSGVGLGWMDDAERPAAACVSTFRMMATLAAEQY
jgi:hypothetical protein